MLGGFEQPTDGQIFLDGVDVAQSPPHKRPVNTVFQSYALFPHLDVQKNVAYGLRWRKDLDKRTPRGSRQRRRWSWSGSPSTPGVAPTRCREDSSNASPWRGRWSSNRRCCSSTSRWARSTRSSATRCGRS